MGLLLVAHNEAGTGVIVAKWGSHTYPARGIGDVEIALNSVSDGSKGLESCTLVWSRAV